MSSSLEAPFDTGHLDRLMEEAGFDVLIVTSKHNVQYLLGGYRFFMFDYMDAIGLSRYLPVFVYPRGRPDQAFYVGNVNEKFEDEVGRFWVSTVLTKSRGTLDAIQIGLDQLSEKGIPARSIGVETGFLPADAWNHLCAALPDAEMRDCLEVLEELRAAKTADELDLLRLASEGVVGAMEATFRAARPGMTKFDLVETLRREEVNRGLLFEYCLVTAGASLNRAPSGQVLQEGDILSLDSGGNYRGYIGDLCRMGILGEPSAELEDTLGEIDEIQMKARGPIRAGAAGVEIFDAVAAYVARQRDGKLAFLAHGMGLITHEAPRLLDNGPIPYPGKARHEPLKAGMVLSIETTLQHPRLGFIKLEDTVAVTPDGWEAYGDAVRGWNRAGV